MVRSLVPILLFASAASAGAPPKSAPPDPFELGRMGITFSDEGLGISAIEPTLPVARSGLQVGDVFVQVGPVRARQRADIQRLVGGLRPGTKVKVTVDRNGERKELFVTLGVANDDVKATFRRLANPNANEDEVP